MEVRLDSRSALITGGSRGLGLAMAKRFAASGASVAIFAREVDALDAARGEIAAAGSGRVAALSVDVRDAVAIAEGFEAACAEVGPIDILVNNAGTSHAEPFESLDDAAWQHDFDLKLFSAVRLCRLAMPGMRERGWGRVINVLNTAAKAPTSKSAPTSVSRAAGLALTKVLAQEYAQFGVLVTALCTGRLVSHQWHRHHENTMPDKSFDEFVEAVGRRIPIGRMGDAEEFANLACFLASDKASYITGTAINVDGGLSPVV
jgi:NAD(P)-dependent dehydrogenase (short-subunit alcohol dehydrogenase family)